LIVITHFSCPGYSLTSYFIKFSIVSCSSCMWWTPASSAAPSIWYDIMRDVVTKPLFFLTMCLLWNTMPLRWTSLTSMAQLLRYLSMKVFVFSMVFHCTFLLQYIQMRCWF